MPRARTAYVLPTPGLPTEPAGLLVLGNSADHNGPMVKPRDASGVFSGVTGYHWVVVLIAAAGWTFDCMDARLFVLAREPALKDLLAGHLD